MTFKTLHYERVGRVAVITYDRQARRNAWSLGMYREVVAAVEQANADDAVGAIVITHAGPVFCSGADAKDGPHEKDPVTGIRPSMATESMAQDTSWLHLLARSKPSIAAVAGRAIGAGVTQILPMDIRMGSESSTYDFRFLKLGLMPEIGATALLPQVVGYGRAVDICLTARELDAHEAERIGLITWVVSDATLRDSAIALGERMASFPALQMRLTRDLLRQNALETKVNLLLERERRAFITMFKARRAAEG